MDYYETLARWNAVKAEIRALQAEEKALRSGLFAGSFPAPKEGTNNLKLPDGSTLKGTYKINRKLLPAEFDARWPEIAPQLPNPDALIKIERSLVLSAYRDLAEPQQRLVDLVLEIKPAGIHELEYVPPKKEK